MARAEDASPPAAELVLLAALAASLIAVVFTFAQAGHAQAPQRGWLAVLAITSIALGWAAVHTVYLLRYARLYYSPPEGGIDFHGEAPDYLDFAYLALSIGMTFQVSDTDLMGKRVRRLALRHALLSYLFGTVIVASTVSSAAALLRAYCAYAIVVGAERLIEGRAVVRRRRHRPLSCGVTRNSVGPVRAAELRTGSHARATRHMWHPCAGRRRAPPGMGERSGSGHG
jgi:uncharacterized membrane protein HdeD (DUF308 family)